MVSQWFDSEIGCIKYSSVDAATPESPIGINFANKLNSFPLLRDLSNLFELTAQEPEVAEKHRLSQRDWCGNYIHQ